VNDLQENQASRIYAAEPAATLPPHTDRLAIVALAMGIVALLSLVIFMGLLLGPLASIMGFISLRRIAAGDGELRGRGLALAGLVLGLVAFVLGGLTVLVASSFGNLVLFY
jgi:hypothetical protein